MHQQFSSLVINGFGWSKFNTMLVGLPAGFLQVLFIWITVIGIRVTKIPRCYWGLAAAILPLIGNIGIMAVPMDSKWGIVVFTWLASLITPCMVVTMSLLASNIKGNTKKSAVSNGYFILYALGAIIAPQLWQTADAPRYIKGITADIVCFGCVIVLFVAYRFLAVRENNRRDALEASGQQQGDGAVPDCTDREDMSFRYVS